MSGWARGRSGVPFRASTWFGLILAFVGACVEAVIPALVGRELHATEAQLSAARTEVSQLHEERKVRANLRSNARDEASHLWTLEREAVKLVSRYTAFGAEGLVTALETSRSRKGASASIKLNLQGQAPYSAVAELVMQCDAPGALLSIRQLDLSQDSVDGRLLRVAVSLTGLQ